MRKIILVFLAMCLAAVTSLAIDNEFKNILLNIDFSKTGEGSYNINLETQVPYPEEIKIVKKSDYNYYILLAETYAKSAVNKINPEITTAEVNLYPYVEQDTNNGYTKITLNTSKPLNFSVSLSAKAASKFPVMDLVKIAKLNQMYDKYNTTVKDLQTVVAKKPMSATTPKPTTITTGQKPVSIAVKKPAATQIKQPVSSVSQQQINIKPTQTKAPVKIVMPTKVVTKPQIIRQIQQKSQATPVKVVQKQPKTSATKIATAKKPVIKPAAKAPQKIAVVPAGKTVAKAQKPVSAPDIKVRPKIATTTTQASKKPIATPIKQTPAASKAPDKTAAKTFGITKEPQAAQQIKDNEQTQKIAQKPIVTPTIGEQQEQTNLFKEYPIQLIIFLCAILAFFIGIFQLLILKLRGAKSNQDSIGIGPRTIFEESKKQDLNNEEFEQILDENIYSKMPNETSEADLENFETIMPDFQDSYNQEVETIDNIESEPELILQEPKIQEAQDVKEPEIAFETPTKEDENITASETIQTELIQQSVNKEDFEIAKEENSSFEIQNEDSTLESFVENDFKIDLKNDIKLEVQEAVNIAEEISDNETSMPEIQMADSILDNALSDQAEEIKEETPEPTPVSNPIKTEPPLQKQESAKILSTAQVENDRGFYLANFKGVTSLVAFVMDNVFVIHSFKGQKINNPEINFRLSESSKQGDFYLVKVENTKLLVKSEQERMSLVNVA